VQSIEIAWHIAGALGPVIAIVASVGMLIGLVTLAGVISSRRPWWSYLSLAALLCGGCAAGLSAYATMDSIAETSAELRSATTFWRNLLGDYEQYYSRASNCAKVGLFSSAPALVSGALALLVTIIRRPRATGGKNGSSDDSMPWLRGAGIAPQIRGGISGLPVVQASSVILAALGTIAAAVTSNYDKTDAIAARDAHITVKVLPHLQNDQCDPCSIVSRTLAVVGPTRAEQLMPTITQRANQCARDWFEQVRTPKSPRSRKPICDGRGKHPVNTRYWGQRCRGGWHVGELERIRLSPLMLDPQLRSKVDRHIAVAKADYLLWRPDSWPKKATDPKP